MKHALAILALSFAGCGDEVTLTVTEPEGSVELLPGGTVDFSWTLSGGTELVIDATPLGIGAGTLIFDQDVPAGEGTFRWTGVDLEANPLPPHVYQVELVAVGDDFGDDFALRTITIHGIQFRDPAPGDTVVVAATTYNIHAWTVSSRPLDLTYSLVDGATEIVFFTDSIGGEFVPFDRTVVFDGTGIPAGVYTVVVDATDGAGLDYRVEGGSIDWQP